MKKAFKVICLIIASIVLIVALIIVGFNGYQHISNSAFYANAEKEYKVPGISDGLIQQGFFGVDDGNVLVCGYMKDGSASRVYLLDSKGEVLNYVTLEKDGEPNTSHAGGLCCVDGNILITAHEGLDVYSYEEVKSANKGSAVKNTGFIGLPFSPAFVYADASRLIAGEFYREQNYQTDESHHMKTPSGEQHHAIALIADLEQFRADGMKYFKPVAVLSIPDLAQGMASDDKGILCVSTSYAVAMSHLYFYNDPTTGKPDGEFEIDGEEYPLYYLDSDNLNKDVSLYPMAEEIFFRDGKLYIINESASAKYIFGKFTGGASVYSYRY